MNSFHQHDEIQAFLKQVCHHIKAKEVHREVRMELESHLQELIDEKLSKGLNIDTAVSEAIGQMGTPDVIGQQLHQAHLPRFNWGLLAIIVLFMTIGLVAIFSVQVVVPNRLGSIIAMKQVVLFGIGTCLMLLIGFINYSKLVRYSWVLYVSTIVLFIFALLTGNVIGGLKGYVSWGPFQMNISTVSPYLLLVALAGIWSSPQRIISNDSYLQELFRKSWINIGTVWLPSLLILYTNSVENFILFFFGSLTILVVLRKKRSIIGTHCSLFVASFGLFLLKIGYQSDQVKRFFSITHPNEDKFGMNYVVIQSKMAIHSAGWWGHGFGASFSTLPILQSEMMFPFLIYCFGWGAGIAMVAMVTLFVQQTVGVTRKVKDPYGKALVSGLLIVFVIQYFWNMLMSIGLAPYSAFNLPFVSYSGTLVIFQFIAIGLILSVYRRKDLGIWRYT